MELQELKLKITPRAQEWLSAMGTEFTLTVMQLRGPRGQFPAAVCRLGAPNESDGFTRLSGDGLIVWVPNAESFIRNEVLIDLFGAGGMVLPIAMTAILIPECEGVCDLCASNCAVKQEEF